MCPPIWCIPKHIGRITASPRETVAHLTLRFRTLLCMVPICAAAQTLTPSDVARIPSERRALLTVDDPASGYFDTNTDDVADQLNRRLANGSASLVYEEGSGYVRSVLEHLGISAQSQLVVYSKTSVQAPRISPANPRALFFSDDAVVGYIRGAPFLEIAVQDPRRGILFYTLAQQPRPEARLARAHDCVRCHVSHDSMDVPGMLMRSIPTGPDGRIYPQLGNFVTDDRSAFEERWGGWYVTGDIAGARHMGNLFVQNPTEPDAPISAAGPPLTGLSGKFDVRGYPNDKSDVVALMVFEHQMHMMSLLVRVGWDARAAARHSDAGSDVVRTMLANDARELVDSMLFQGEPPLPGPVRSTSGFAAEFESRGPFDRRGRSLRQLDLQHRLMRYPCSYMIYSRAFDGLPDEAKAAIYLRLWEILSDPDPSHYATLSVEDRRAIVGILVDTRKDLPGYFALRS